MEWLYSISLTNSRGQFVLTGETLNPSVSQKPVSYNTDYVEMYGKMFIQDLIRAIPQSGVAKVLSAYLNSELSRFPPDSENDIDDASELITIRITSEEILDDMIVFPTKRS